MQKNHSQSTFPMKFKPLDFNVHERLGRAGKGQVRLANTFKKLSNSRTRSKDSAKVIIPKLRSITPSHLFESKYQRKQGLWDKKKGAVTAKNNKLTFSFVKKSNLKKRNLSSNSTKPFIVNPKSQVSVKSRNREYSTGSTGKWGMVAASR